MKASTKALLVDLFDEQRELLNRALTRKAWLEEQSGSGNYDATQHHEAIEFLGDAWLGAIVADELYRRFPQATEKELTRSRESLVDTEHLADVARAHEIETALRVGAGERKQAQHLEDKPLAAHVEALIGAAHLVGGSEASRRVVMHLFEGRWPSEAAPERIQDVKGELQRRELARHRVPGSEPKYSKPCEQDPPAPAHPMRFRSQVTLYGGETFEGDWRPNKRDAELSAAQVALEALTVR